MVVTVPRPTTNDLTETSQIAALKRYVVTPGGAANETNVPVVLDTTPSANLTELEDLAGYQAMLFAGIISDQSDPPWWQQRLESIASLSENWDSYGALAPTFESKAAMQRLMELVADYRRGLGSRLSLPTDIYPLPNGAIEAEWKGAHSTLSIEARPSGGFGLLLRHGVGREARYLEAEFEDRGSALGLILSFEGE